MLIPLARKRPGLAGAMAILVVTLDLAVANSRYVSTVPQVADGDQPEVVRIIEEAERKDLRRAPSGPPDAPVEPARSGLDQIGRTGSASS